MGTSTKRFVGIAFVGLLLTGCGSVGTEESSRERCEDVAGVNNCIEVGGEWVPAPSTTEVTTTTEQTTTTETPTTTTAAPIIPETTLETAVVGAGPGDVRDEPAGQFCRDLDAKGYSYSAAVDYWRMHGQPNQMDADRNGIPCETVYPRSDVIAYWGQTTWVDPMPVGLPSGLFCRDLDARGISYPDAVAYWFAEGAPDRMDADLNGIPCETVYPRSDVIAYWG